MTEPRVIVGVDGSPSSQHAARWAAAFAQRTGRALVAVLVWEYPLRASLPSTGDGSVPTTAEMERDAAAQLAEVMAPIRQSTGVPVEELVGEGYPSIVVMNQALPGDVIVVGTRGRGALRQLLLGSTSRQVVTHATVPVVVVPEGATLELGTVVVGVDGSDGAVDALRWALTLGASIEVVALHSWTVPTLFPVDTEAVAYQELERQATERLEEAIAKATAGVEPDAPPVRGVLRYGDARTHLTQLPDDMVADLVVVGARGHGPLTSALLGSVSTFLISHAETAVAIVHSR